FLCSHSIICPLSFPPSPLFFIQPSPSEIYTLSLHDALPICRTDSFSSSEACVAPSRPIAFRPSPAGAAHLVTKPIEGIDPGARRSEEHTSELQSRENLVCRLLLEKKKKKITKNEGQTSEHIK